MTIGFQRACARILLAGILAGAPALPAVAVGINNWTAGTGDWFTAANWDTGVPVANNEVNLTNGGTAQINATTPTVRNLNVNGGSTIQLLTGGQLSNTAGFGTFLGDGTTGGTAILDGGSFTGTGAVTLNKGTLIVNQDYALSNSLALAGTGNTIQVASGKRLQLTQMAVTAGGVTIASGFVSYNSDFFYTGDTVINSGATLALGIGGVTGAATSSTNFIDNGTVNIQHSGTFNLNNNVSGTGGITLVAGNTATVGLTGTNTYSGTTNVLGGTLLLNNAAGISPNATFNVGTGATIKINTVATMKNLTGAGTVLIDQNDPAPPVFGLKLTNANFTGTITETSGKPVTLQVLTGGTVILAGTNGWTGATTIDAGGTLQIGNGGTGGNLPTGAITNNGTLAFAHSDTFSYGGTLTSGALAQVGPGVLNLTAANSYAGGTTVTGGLINFTALNNFGTGAITLNGGGLQWGTATTLDVSPRLAALGTGGGTLDTNGNTVTLATAITGNGPLTKAGAGTLILTGTASYSGSTTIQAGTLQIGNGGTAGALPGGAIANSGTLIFNRSDNVALPSVLSGTGTLIQAGSGTLTVSGNSAGFTGATTVNAGTLAVNGTLGGVVTANGGTIVKGNGTVGGLVVASGATAAPGNSIGTLNVNGNVSFAANSIYQVEADAAAADRITATGTATLSGGAVQVSAAAGNYGSGSTYTILSAAGGVSGTFSSVSLDRTDLLASLSYTPNSVVLTLKAPFPAVTGTPNQIAAGTAIQAGGSGTGLYNAVSGMSSAAAQAAFDAASGEIHATLLAASFGRAEVTRDTLLSRMRLAQGEGWQVWADARGGWGHIDGDGNAARARTRTVNVTLGADTALDENWRAGIEAGYSGGTVDVAARASGADVTGGQIGAYAYGRYDAVALRAGFSYGFANARTLRGVNFAAFTDAVSAGQDLSTVQLFGEAGYDIALGGFTLEPFAGLAWTQLSAGAFQESGAAARLAGTARDSDDGFSTLGVQLFGDTPEGGILAPSARLGWQHAFTNRLAARGLSILETGKSFTVWGTPRDGDRAVLNLDATLNLSAARVTLGYTGGLSAHVQDHGVHLMAEMAL